MLNLMELDTVHSILNIYALGSGDSRTWARRSAPRASTGEV